MIYVVKFIENTQFLYSSTRYLLFIVTTLFFHTMVKFFKGPIRKFTLKKRNFSKHELTSSFKGKFDTKQISAFVSNLII